MAYVGDGTGSYIQETTYQYVGYGGDFEPFQQRRDFTCLVCCPILLVLLPLLLWWLWSLFHAAPYDCDRDYVIWDVAWSQRKRMYCCETEGRGCPTTAFPATTPEVPPTPPPTPPVTPTRTPPPTGDPHNCAIGEPVDWSRRKRRWCCRVHHKGCRPTLPPPTPPITFPPTFRPPPDPYNCADGYDNWQAGWSIGKKTWCCRVHGKGCPMSTGCVTTSEPYDCEAGYANWQAGWSIRKKAWCCKNKSKGCPNQIGCA